MKNLRDILEQLRAFHGFRVLYSKAFPVLDRLRITSFLRDRDGGGGGDPWGHNKNSENFRAFFERYAVDPKTVVRPRRDYLFGFLMMPNKEDIKNIEDASAALGTRFEIFDIRNPAFFRELRAAACDGLFIRPALENNNLRSFFHEATQILSSDPKLKIYPSVLELNIYEAKRTTASFLAVHDIPHPATHVFCDRAKAAEFIEDASFPLVFKTHVGSSANGVEILRTKRQAVRLAKRLFDRYYLKKNEFENRSREWGYMLLQEYVAGAKEHRVLKIGDSWFGHQKGKTEEQMFFSGSGIERHIDPPKALLDFCHDIAEKFHFTTMNFDIFENERGEYLVNELQTWFGSYNPSQMYIDGVPGRYRKLDGEWVFEPGLFNVHGSMLLRIAHFVEILEREEGIGAPAETISRP